MKVKCQNLSKALAGHLGGQIVKLLQALNMSNVDYCIFPVPIVQETVGKYAKHIVYYSETEDPSIPTENIGVPNTERGNIRI